MLAGPRSKQNTRERRGILCGFDKDEGNHRGLDRKVGAERNVLIFDLGGGTLMSQSPPLKMGYFGSNLQLETPT